MSLVRLFLNLIFVIFQVRPVKPSNVYLLWILACQNLKCILGPESSYLQIGIQEFPYFVGNTKCCINVNLEMCDQTEVFLCTQR